MSKIKKSVLKTFLFVCLGLSIATIAFADTITSEPPSPPGRPNVNSITITGCKLQYKAPLNDGGSPIIGYYIEYKYESNNLWRALNLVPNKGLTFTVTNATEGERAQFRVIAVNEAGRGEPSIPSDAITFTNPFRL